MWLEQTNASSDCEDCNKQNKPASRKQNNPRLSRSIFQNRKKNFSRFGERLWALSFQPKIPELSETGCGGEGNGTKILWENINFRMAHISNPNWKNTVKKFRLLNKKFPVSRVIFVKFVYSLRGWMSSFSETLCKRKDRSLGPVNLAFLGKSRNGKTNTKCEVLRYLYL